MPTIADYRNKFPSLRELDDNALIDRVAQVQGVARDDVIAHMGYKPKPAGFLRSVADLGIEAVSGVARGVKATADAFGADNAVSQGADTVDKFARDYLSASSKADDRRVSEIMAAAQDAGVWEQVKAAAEAFTVKPAGMIANALGTSVPTIATALIPGVGQAGAVARLGALGAMGAAQGAGAVKGSIYEAVKAEQIKAGASEADAEAAAVKAQEYGGANTANIAGGAALGAAASATGVQPVIAKMLQRSEQVAAEVGKRGMIDRALNPEGLLARTGMGALKETPLEAAQGGQEQYASNIALQNEGFDTPAFRGVAGSAALEGLAAAGPGAAFGALDKPRVRAEAPPPPAPAAPVLPLPYGSSKPMVQFRDGSVGTQEDAERYINSLPEKDRPAARAKLLGLAPQKVGVSDVLGAESVDDAIDLANKAVGLKRPIPAGEATEFDALPDNLPVEDITYAPPPDKVLAGQASELTPEVINADAALMRFRTPQQIADNGIGPIPTGEAADLIPTGDAAEFETLPVGEILDGDLMAKDGEPFTSKTGAQAKAYASGGGKVVTVPNHFGSGQPGYVVRPLMPGRPNNTRGTNANDVARPDGPRAADAGRGERIGVLRDGRPGDVLPSTEGTAGQGVAGPGAAGGASARPDALTVQKGLTVTFGGKTYPVQSINDAQEKWVRFRDSADGGMAAGVSQVGNGVVVSDSDGKFVARISYNGRAFDGEDVGARVLAEAPDGRKMPQAVLDDEANGIETRATGRYFLPPKETLEEVVARSTKARDDLARTVDAPTLTEGQRVTLKGESYTVKDSKPSAVVLTRTKPDGGTESRIVKAGTDNWKAIQPADAQPTPAPRTEAPAPTAATATPASAAGTGRAAGVEADGVKPRKTLQEARADAALDKQVRENGEQMTRRQWVERKVAEGLKTKVTQEDRIKPMSRMAYFRANNEEQRAHDRKVKEAGKKDVFWIGDYEVTKTEHDYANALTAEKAATPNAAAPASTQAPAQAGAPVASAPAKDPRELGRQAAKDGKPRDPPDALSNPDKQVWRGGWDQAKKAPGPTPQLPSPQQLASFIGIAADNISKLRASDVDRVINETPAIYRVAVAQHIRNKRPDLAQDVADSLEDMGTAPVAAPAPQAAATPDAAAEPQALTLDAIPKSLQITLELEGEDGKTQKKLVNARKAFLAASQRVEKLKALKECVG